MLKSVRLFAILVVCVVGTGCGGTDGIVIPERRPVTQLRAVDFMAPPRMELEQNWSADVRMRFWFTSQGSRLVPYQWFTWLEQPDSTELFRSAEHMDGFRYLPMPPSSLNPSGLPIGFALDTDENGRASWMGLTCAACHTAQVDYQGTRMLIEGGPTMGNAVALLDRLVKALGQTGADDGKFDRFAHNVLGDGYDEATAAQLRTDLADVTRQLALRQEVNALPPGEYPAGYPGYSRLDAFGNIQNAGSALALHDPSNKNTPNAPVSYPFLWGTHQSSVVQWNGTAPNTPVVGPLVRNMGEVVGVFGGLTIERPPWWQFWRKTRYSSTIKYDGLGDLEVWVKALRSPAWPEDVLPPIDPVLAAQGEAIYRREAIYRPAGCASCHQVIARADEGDNYAATLTPVDEVGTDLTMALNARAHPVRTLFLEGTPKAVLGGERFGPETPALDIAVNGVIGLVLKDPLRALAAGLRPEIGDAARGRIDYEGKTMEELVQEHAQRADAGLIESDRPFAYKARPLNGIWATAPYLHNGSVPNLWALLTPPASRPDSFYVGSREFDPTLVGFDTGAGPNTTLFRVFDDDSRPITGNSNAGHVWGTDLTDDEKRALIEYLKSL